jgi:phenylacetate-coenzyme A ligase PaaK-like adenylate-forming protein
MEIFEELFEEKKSEINQTLKFILNNQYSDFYNKKLGNISLPINTYGEFTKLPFLFRDDIIDTTIYDRLFIPESEVSFYSLSSGTTGSKKPVIMPQKLVRFENIENNLRPFNIDNFKKIGLRNIMHIAPTFSGAVHMVFKQNWGEITPIIADPQHLKLMAILAKEIDLEGIITSPTGLMLFAQELEEVSFDFNNLKIILLTGELCTEPKLEELITFLVYLVIISEYFFSLICIFSSNKYLGFSSIRQTAFEKNKKYKQSNQFTFVII